MSESTQHNANINRKLLNIQRSLQAISKDNVNKGMGYKFRSIGQAMSALKPLIDEQGVLLSIHEQLAQTVEHERGMTVLLSQIVTFTDAESGEFETCGAIGQGTDTGDKAAPKASTCAFKNIIFKRFCIPDDSDSEHESPTTNKKPLIGGKK